MDEILNVDDVLRAMMPPPSLVRENEFQRLRLMSTDLDFEIRCELNYAFQTPKNSSHFC